MTNSISTKRQGAFWLLFAALCAAALAWIAWELSEWIVSTICAAIALLMGWASATLLMSASREAAALRASEDSDAESVFVEAEVSGAIENTAFPSEAHAASDMPDHTEKHTPTVAIALVMAAIVVMLLKVGQFINFLSPIAEDAAPKQPQVQEPTAATLGGLSDTESETLLAVLAAGGTSFTQPGTKRLAKIDLSGTAVSDAFLGQHLTHLQHLRVLNLRFTHVTDNGLVHLHALKTLRTIELEGTAVTAAGIQELTRVLPDCHINQ